MPTLPPQPKLPLHLQPVTNPPVREQERTVSIELVRVEKNLASLGFFTPSNKKVKGVKSKTIHFNKQVDGKRIEVKAVILPSAAYGLPITSDQDKYLAFQKILSEIRNVQGQIRNPVGFSSADILRILNLDTDAGKHYEDVVEWGKRMTLTGISSEGTIYFAGQKTWATDTFHVFERFVSCGNQMPDGSMANRNYVWLSEWQLENINHNHLLPIDLESYRQLRNHIAKALVPLLQVWLYATTNTGLFEKRYRDLCQILNITEYKHPSKIKEKLGPSLSELQNHGYLSAWQIHPTSDGTDFKIVFIHGRKFQGEPTCRTEVSAFETVPPGHTQDPTPPTPHTKVDRELLHQLMKRGISEKASVSLLKGLKPDQHIMDQLEWGDHLVLHSPNKHKFFNPAGLYIHLVKENTPPPETFETSRRRSMREAAQQAREKEAQELAALQLTYVQYQEQQLDQFVQENAEEFHSLVEAKKKRLAQETHWKRIFAGKQDILQKAAERQVRMDLLGRAGIVGFDEFCQERPVEVQRPAVMLVNESEQRPPEGSEMSIARVPESSPF